MFKIFSKLIFLSVSQSLLSLWCDPTVLGGTIVIQILTTGTIGVFLGRCQWQYFCCILCCCCIQTFIFSCFHKIKSYAAIELDKLCLYLLATKSLVCLEIISTEIRVGSGHQSANQRPAL